tara:strand:+ start:33 stop:371 length:339 start_codon:yes stop_codon:yes gene_type:complete
MFLLECKNCHKNYYHKINPENPWAIPENKLCSPDCQNEFNKNGKGRKKNKPPRNRIDVNSEACVGEMCKVCEKVCPVPGTVDINKIAVINNDPCTYCGICVKECPNWAIKIS